MNQMQRFINRVAGTIHDRQPGSMVTVSVVAKLLYQPDDAALIAAVAGASTVALVTLGFRRTRNTR